jgi:hypothetical protein
MKKLDEFINANEEHIVKKTNGVTESTIVTAEDSLDLRFGEELKSYLFNYGFLIYKFVELLGLTNEQGESSDLIVQTKRARENLHLDSKYVVIENLGDGLYVICDSKDNVFNFQDINNTITPLNVSLIEYILNRFKSIA